MGTGEGKPPNPMARAEIDLSALSHNVAVIQKRLCHGSTFMAVIKKNAYGHGVIPVARHLVSIGIDNLAVYSLEEGLELRQANIDVPILLFRMVPPRDARIAVAEHLTPTVMDAESAIALNSAAREMDTTVKVHVKVDTGLNRSGASPKDVAELMPFLFGLEHLEVEGLYTHFASADEPDKTPTETQLSRFLDLARTFPSIKLRHTANSAAAIRFPETHLSMVRVGISLYGLYPSDSVVWDIPLKPVLSLMGPIVRIHRLKPGDGVGYGLTWKATNDTVVALVPMGYGDGLPRLLSNRGEALVRGQRVPIRGRVSMDQTVVDITGVPQAEIGDVVTFIGRQPPGEITADEVAAWANTINYEVVTTLPSQLPRILR